MSILLIAIGFVFVFAYGFRVMAKLDEYLNSGKICDDSTDSKPDLHRYVCVRFPARRNHEGLLHNIVGQLHHEEE